MANRRALTFSKPKDLGRTLRQFVAYLGHARRRLVVVAVLVAVSAVANLLGTYMIKPVVNRLASADMPGFVSGVVATAVIYALGAASCLGYTQVMVRAAQRVVFDLRRDLFDRIQRLSLSFFDRTRTGES